MTLPRLVCASANPDKVAEIASLLDGLVDLEPRPAGVPDVVEDSGTLEGNARLKATAICRATALSAVADDTGLFVDALDGAPGVDTAYYAGPTATYAQNRTKLLQALSGEVPRTARFRTVVMVVHPDGTELVVEGVCEGVIASEERGERGFGFDPVFIPVDGDGRTFSEMSEADKNLVSHRGRAFRSLVDALRLGVATG
ncbi:MAG: RdgB/HAM1 family non-canonical purine NTP pyrophosphatase [Actinomycetota bacterium]